MKAYQVFSFDLNKLVAFYNATIYSYEQTENILTYQKKNRIPFNTLTESGLLINRPSSFKVKKREMEEIRKNLSEIVFVRVVSALEVFLIDLIRDTFLENKEPFKKHDQFPPFSQAELLSFKSTTEIYSKIINKECRKLSSGGFLDIIKYYKKYFDIDIAGFAPGKQKMEEYHDRRHLLVHRLGKTDQQYREKYKTSKQGISIDQDYLSECINDFKSFSEMVNNQMNYQLQNKFNPLAIRVKTFERKVLIQIELVTGAIPECITPNYEFWADDEFSNINDILDLKKEVGENKLELIISGTARQIKSYLKILRRSQKRKDINLYEKEMKTVEARKKETGETKIFSKTILDEDLLFQVQQRLPTQPWPIGIHKIVAADLNISNKLTSIAIQQLISKGIFKQQINGVLYDQGITIPASAWSVSSPTT